MSIESAYQEVLDAIECDTEGEERCLLLTHAVRAFGGAVLEEAVGVTQPGLAYAFMPRIYAIKCRINDLAAPQRPPEPRERAGEEGVAYEPAEGAA